jgi:hypothetical protein
MISPDIPATVFENVSETLNDSKVMHSAEVWGLEERWKEKETIHCKYSLQKVARIVMGAANQVLKLKLRKHRKRRKVRKRRVK